MVCYYHCCRPQSPARERQAHVCLYCYYIIIIITIISSSSRSSSSSSSLAVLYIYIYIYVLVIYSVMYICYAYIILRQAHACLKINYISCNTNISLVPK